MALLLFRASKQHGTSEKIRKPPERAQQVWDSLPTTLVLLCSFLAVPAALSGFRVDDTPRLLVSHLGIVATTGYIEPPETTVGPSVFFRAQCAAPRSFSVAPQDAAGQGLWDVIRQRHDIPRATCWHSAICRVGGPDLGLDCRTWGSTWRCLLFFALQVSSLLEAYQICNDV